MSKKLKNYIIIIYSINYCSNKKILGTNLKDVYKEILMNFNNPRSWAIKYIIFFDYLIGIYKIYIYEQLKF